MQDIQPEKPSYHRIIIALGIILIASVFYFTWYTPRYDGLVAKLRQDAKCGDQAKQYVTQWSDTVTKNDERLSITTVPGKSRVYYNSHTNTCLIYLTYISQSDSGTTHYETLHDIQAKQSLTERRQFTSTAANKTDSNPNFATELKNLVGK